MFYGPQKLNNWKLNAISRTFRILSGLSLQSHIGIRQTFGSFALYSAGKTRAYFRSIRPWAETTFEYPPIGAEGHFKVVCQPIGELIHPNAEVVCVHKRKSVILGRFLAVSVMK